jgi:hypothetical protein
MIAIDCHEEHTAFSQDPQDRLRGGDGQVINYQSMATNVTRESNKRG